MSREDVNPSGLDQNHPSLPSVDEVIERMRQATAHKEFTDEQKLAILWLERCEAAQNAAKNLALLQSLYAIVGEVKAPQAG